MEAIKIFESPEFGQVRTICSEKGGVYFCLSDLCKVLDLQQRDVVRRLEDEVVSTHPIQDSLGRTQQANFVCENGMYDVILDSRKPIAKKFRRWIVNDVLPSIRETGGYIATSSQDSDEDILQRALLIAQRKIAEKEERNKELQSRNSQLIQQTEKQELEIGRLKAPAEYCREVLQSTDTYTFTQIAKDMDMRNVAELMKFLCEHKIVFRQNGQWLPTANCAGKGFFRSETFKYIKSNGEVGSTMHTKVTEKGRAFIRVQYQRFLDNKR
jgi:prophage antirepressor-like protein